MHKLILASSGVRAAFFVIAASALAIFAMAAPAAAAPPQGGSHSLRAKRTAGDVDLVEAVLEVRGDLKLVEDGKVERVKMSVAANFVYHERSLQVPAGAGGPSRSIRHYSTAEGVIKSGEHEYEPVLSDERHLIGVEVDGPKVTLFSPQGPLRFDELELVDASANSLFLDRLLPERAVAVGRSWEHSDELIAALLGLDEIIENNARSELTEVADGKAQFEMSGRLSGTEEGVATRIELKAKYQFDLDRRRITWFGLLVREDRSAGPVDTGFDVVARLQMRVTPGSSSEHLADGALANVSLKPTAKATQLSYASSGGGWHFSHDRRWSVITEEEGQAVLRFVDRGDKLAQCNVASMPNVTEATEPTLEEFQSDVSRGLSGNFESFVRAGQWHSEADYRVFQVVAEGEISGIPMHWVYYLVANRQGRRVVLAFVLEKEMLGRFDEADKKLVATLRLAEPKLAAKPKSDRQPEGGKR
jgi:hypothetical protein